MAENGRSGFWSSLPGVLTGIAAMMTASVAMFAVLRGPTEDKPRSVTSGLTAPDPAPSSPADPSPRAAALTPGEGSPGCAPGLVWRDARPGDRICVTSRRQAAVAEENALALDRREPAGGTYGENTCKSGYVWRVAVATDLTCVPPESRDLVFGENRAGGLSSKE